MMTIREATALILLYRTCLTGTTVDEIRNAARMAVVQVPELTEYDLCKVKFSKFPFKSHRTQAQVIYDEATR
jgi:hypothetical protein